MKPIYDELRESAFITEHPLTSSFGRERFDDVRIDLGRNIEGKRLMS